MYHIHTSTSIQPWLFHINHVMSFGNNINSPVSGVHIFCPVPTAYRIDPICASKSMNGCSGTGLNILNGRYIQWSHPAASHSIIESIHDPCTEVILIRSYLSRYIPVGVSLLAWTRMRNVYGQIILFFSNILRMIYLLHPRSVYLYNPLEVLTLGMILVYRENPIIGN